MGEAHGRLFKFYEDVECTNLCNMIFNLDISKAYKHELYLFYETAGKYRSRSIQKSDKKVDT